MNAPEEFAGRMERVERLVAALDEQADHPLAQTAAELLQAASELHGVALQKMLALIQAGGDDYRPLLERFAQDDLIRSLLLYHDLHPIPLRSRLEEAIDNLRPLIESYGGKVWLGRVDQRQATVHLDISTASGPSPEKMLKELLENAALICAPDVAELQIVSGAPPERFVPLPILSSR